MADSGDFDNDRAGTAKKQLHTVAQGSGIAKVLRHGDPLMEGEDQRVQCSDRLHQPVFYHDLRPLLSEGSRTDDPRRSGCRRSSGRGILRSTHDERDDERRIKNPFDGAEPPMTSVCSQN